MKSHRNGSRFWIFAVITLVTGLYLLAFALNFTPYLRGPASWRWAYAIPGVPVRHVVPVSIVSMYTIVALIWLRSLNDQPRPTPIPHTSQSPASPSVKSVVPFLVFVALSVPFIQAALLFPESPDVVRPLFYRTVSAGASGVFTVGSAITDLGDFLRRYPALMPTFPVHPQRYPPGLPVLFYSARQLFEAFPVVSDPLGFWLRLYQCHNFALMRLSNATLATALIQMALPFITGLIVFPLYGLASKTIGRQAALWAIVLYPLVPSFALWSARWDQFYPLLTCTAWYCLWHGLQETSKVPKAEQGEYRHQASRIENQESKNKKQDGFIFHASRFMFLASVRSLPAGRITHHAWFLLSGFILSLVTFLSFGPLVILMPMGLAALLWVLPRPERRQWARLAVGALLFFTGLILPWVAYQLAFDSGFPDIWRVSMAYHLGLKRNYGVWLFYHMYDFLAFLGMPLALLFVAGLVLAIRSGWKDDQAVLPLSFGLGLLLLDLSGTARGEVARVWLFLTPFAVIGAAYGLSRLSRKRWHNAVAIVLLAAQLLVFNAFLRVVTTGITDPPTYTHGLPTHKLTHLLNARYGKQIELIAYEVEPESVRPGSRLDVTFTWRAITPIPRPYTVFVHLLGPDGSLVAQHDGMPQQGQAPTTCWIPREHIPDSHTLVIPDDTAPGEYALITGLYFWETGERLPSEGPTATPDGHVLVTAITVKGKTP